MYTVGQLEEYGRMSMTLIVNNQPVTCPKFVEVNGSLEPASYEIKEGDVIETRNYYTVSQVIEFMDVEIDEDREILVNNKPADMDTLVYDNFSIEWTVLSFGVAPDDVNSYNATEEAVTENGIDYENRSEEYEAVGNAQEASDVSETVDNRCIVTVNGETVELMGKESYIFVDIFDRITFDLNAGRGRAIATMVNGMDAEFSQELHDGDRIELYWKEN